MDTLRFSFISKGALPFAIGFQLIDRILKMQRAEQELEQDFSKPWKHSDVILVVEGREFHVHRVVLSLISSVFSRMFSAEFKEKYAEKIPLPEKKADEIRELLLAIYPNSWRPVHEKNCYFLLALAQEYQMTKLTKRCEDFLLRAVETQQGANVLETLVVAQNYTLERVIDQCIKKTETLSVHQLRSHEMYQHIKPLTQRRMIDLQVHKVEEENSRMKKLAAEAMEDVNSVVSVLGKHIRQATPTAKPLRYPISPALNMQTIQCDQVGPDCLRTGGGCSSLSSAYIPLKDLQSRLTEMLTQKTS